DQCEAVGRRFGCLAQEIAEGHVADDRRGRSGDVGLRKSQDFLPAWQTYGSGLALLAGFSPGKDLAYQNASLLRFRQARPCQVLRAALGRPNHVSSVPT